MFAKIQNHANIRCNITLPLTASKSPLYEGKLIFPVVTASRGVPEIVSGCGHMSGSISYEPIPPDPRICSSCANSLPITKTMNCSFGKIASACTSAPIVSPDPDCVACTGKAASELGCIVTDAAKACSDDPIHPIPGSMCSKAKLERLRTECLPKCSAKVVQEIARACVPKPPPPPKPVPAGASRCVTFVLAAGETSEWVDVGRLIDSMNHAPWNLPPGNYTITIGLKHSNGSISELESFPSNNTPLQVRSIACRFPCRRYSDASCSRY